MNIEFTKAEALGNDYILLDLFKHPEYRRLLDKMGGLASILSDRHFGIGGDGVILVIPSEKYDCEMKIFNSDGSEAEMCGNGIRQVARYFYDNINRKDSISVDTKAGIKVIDVMRSERLLFRVDMGEPIFEPSKVPIDTSILDGDRVINQSFDFGFDRYDINVISMGNPHCVIFLDDLSDVDLSEVGPRIEKHPLFPNRVNVEFVRVLKSDEIAMRVWERGSGETMACGTGACASVVSAVVNEMVKPGRVRVHLLGGNLDVEYNGSGKVYMIGGANLVFNGVWVKELSL